MKPFLIFGGQCFYARGGFNDLIGHADTLEEAAASAIAIETDGSYPSLEWWQIVDIRTGEVVSHSIATPLGGTPQESNRYNQRFVDGNLVVEDDTWNEVPL